MIIINQVASIIFLLEPTFGLLLKLRFIFELAVQLNVVEIFVKKFFFSLKFFAMYALKMQRLNPYLI